MHSSKLRGKDFNILWQNQPTDHATYFATLSKTDRVGIFAPNGYDGVGAITLVMAYVTAFYNCYRDETEDFFAYPDYFSFQRTDPVAHYSMFDIWPAHKNVRVSQNANETAAAITDRGINILLVPKTSTRNNTFEPVQQEALLRNIQRCYLYDPTGQIEKPDLTITCATKPLTDWTQAVFKSLSQDTIPSSIRQHWENITKQKHFTQTFRQLPLEKAIQYL